VTIQYVVDRDDHTDPDVTAAWLWQAGADGVWVQPDAVVGYFASETPDVPEGGRWEPVPDVDWVARWKEEVQPVSAGPFDVVPTWLADDHPVQAGRIRIVLDPGRAFGSGHHDTTLGCLEALGDLDLEGRTVLDVGTGTGILAIAAAMHGAAHVVGVDLDPAAVEVAAGNAGDNDVRVDLAVGSVGDVHGPFDVVVANLLTDTLVSMATDLVRAVAPGGHLITSGIGMARADVVADALAEAGLADVHTRVRGAWAIVSGHRPA
jgi:ribosomal protein L11 methyltransferase